MDRWIKFSDATRPRQLELIMVKSEAGIFPRMLIVEGPTDFWEYKVEDKEYYAIKKFFGIHLSFHGLTHWTLLDSPY